MRGILKIRFNQDYGKAWPGTVFGVATLVKGLERWRGALSDLADKNEV